MQVKSIAECSKGSILQHFRPSLNYHLPSRLVLSFFEWPLKTGFTVCIIFQYWSFSLYDSLIPYLQVNSPSTHCLLGSFSCFCCRLLTFSKLTFSFKKFFQEHYQSVIQLGSNLGPNFFVKVITRQHKMLPARKELKINSPLIFHVFVMY